jgi:MFS family permease
MFPLANGVFLAFTLSLYMFTTFPTVQMYPLYRSLMGDKTAHQLVTAWGGIYPLCGMMGLVALGPLVDKLGLRFTITLCIPLAVVNSQLFTVRMYGIQIAAQVLLAYLTNVTMVFVPRFCLHYAPAEIFGTVFGLYGFMNGLCQMALTPLATLVGASIAQAFYKTASKAFGFIFSIDIWAGFS